MRNNLSLFILMIVAMVFTRCAGDHNQAIETNRTASIVPEYYDLTIPPNIAPLNFIIKEPGSKFRAKTETQLP